MGIRVMGAIWRRLIQENDRPREELRRARLSEVKISKPVPEAKDSKVVVLSSSA